MSNSIVYLCLCVCCSMSNSCLCVCGGGTVTDADSKDAYSERVMEEREEKKNDFETCL